MARLGLGAEWRCLFANDIDPKKAAAYRANFGVTEFIEGDIGALCPENFPGHADLAWASFPCQDLSLAGLGAGLRGARSGLFWTFWRIIKGLADEGRAPTLVVIENVTGLLTSHRGGDFAAICEAIAHAGYFAGAVVLDAADFLPQSRPTAFHRWSQGVSVRKIGFVRAAPAVAPTRASRSGSFIVHTRTSVLGVVAHGGAIRAKIKFRGCD